MRPDKQQNMKRTNNNQLLSKHEMMEIKGGYFPISPSPMIPFITSYCNEIYNRIKNTCSRFITGQFG